jgi:hypothetical protein
MSLAGPALFAAASIFAYNWLAALNRQSQQSRYSKANFNKLDKRRRRKAVLIGDSITQVQYLMLPNSVAQYKNTDILLF